MKRFTSLLFVYLFVVNFSPSASTGNPTALQGNGGIGDYVWSDLNKNGIQEQNEVGISNVTVKLFFGDGSVRTATTNSVGYYIFGELSPGSYTVQFITPSGMTSSPSNAGADETRDSDPVNGEVAVTLANDEAMVAIDAGFYKTTCASTPAITDTDGDCITDADDIDDDNDGILDHVENGGYDAYRDCDFDGTPNYLDPTPGCPPVSGNDIYGNRYKTLTGEDCNGDGIIDFFDWDRDGIINELDLDSDNDGILDLRETRDKKASDSNSDGMVDGTDTDNDGLLSTADANDNDASIAASIGLTPADLDRDKTPNFFDLDSDGDGLADNREALELDPFIPGYNGFTYGTNDDDHDGVITESYTSDFYDADNFKGFGALGIILYDYDNDGLPNAYDIDSDNDGITDNVESQPTCAEVQPSGEDIDNDGLDDAYDFEVDHCMKNAAGITPYDKDFDSTPDIRDLDSDNDGAPDVNEGSGIFGNFVTDNSDIDLDGLFGQFDVFNIKTANSNLVNNVAHSNMGAAGGFHGPIPPGSNAKLPQSPQGSCPDIDRDWRNVSLLPITLLHFKGNMANKVVKLNWSAENEVNMSHYIVERSTNGVEYAEVSKVTAVNNGPVITGYSIEDTISNLSNTTIYYRLKEVDKTGGVKFSNVLSFKVSETAGITMSIYPNPARSYFVLKLNAIKEGSVTTRLTDLAGKTVLAQKTRIISGMNTVTINAIGRLAAGTYQVQVLIDGQRFNQKLVISK